MNDTGADAPKRKPTLHRIADLDRANAEQRHEHRPVPRAWREEFDRLRPIRPMVYRKPAPKSEEPQEKPEEKA